MAVVRKYLSLKERLTMLIFGIASLAVAWWSLGETFEMAEVVTMTAALLGLGGLAAAIIGVNQAKF